MRNVKKISDVRIKKSLICSLLSQKRYMKIYQQLKQLKHLFHFVQRRKDNFCLHLNNFVLSEMSNICRYTYSNKGGKEL